MSQYIASYTKIMLDNNNQNNPKNALIIIVTVIVLFILGVYLSK